MWSSLQPPNVFSHRSVKHYYFKVPRQSRVPRECSLFCFLFFFMYLPLSLNLSVTLSVTPCLSSCLTCYFIGQLLCRKVNTSVTAARYLDEATYFCQYICTVDLYCPGHWIRLNKADRSILYTLYRKPLHAKFHSEHFCASLLLIVLLI